MDLPDFLLARIAEDENVARSVQDVPAKSGSDVFTSLSAPTGTVEMSPRRVLAECEAKRRIVEQSQILSRHGAGRVVAPEMRWVLASLALPYADHPDYRSEWAV